MPYPFVDSTPQVTTHPQAHNAYVDVMAHFGAKGDGATDDSAAITSAIAALAATGAVLLIPPGTYKCSSQVTLSGNDVQVLAHGATITTSGAISGLKVLGNRNNIYGLTIDHSGNASATYGFDVQGGSAGQGGGRHGFHGCTVRGNASLQASYAAWRFANSAASDVSTGTYWNRLEGCGVVATSGTKPFPLIVSLEGGANNTHIIDCKFSDAVTGVKIGSQTGDVTSPKNIPNSTVLSGTAFETITTAILVTSADTGSNILGPSITNCRFESIGTVLSITTITSQPSVPPFLLANLYSGTPSTFINNPNSIYVNSLEPSITPALGTASMRLGTLVAPFTVDKLDVLGDLRIMNGTTAIGTINHAGSLFTINDTSNNGIQFTGPRIGFYSHTPNTQPAAYTVTNPTTDRGLNVTADTLPQVAEVLGTLIADLQSLGLIG